MEDIKNHQVEDLIEVAQSLESEQQDQQTQSQAAQGQLSAGKHETDKQALVLLQSALSKMLEQMSKAGVKKQPPKKKGSRKAKARQADTMQQDSTSLSIPIKEADGYKDLSQDTVLDLKSQQVLSMLREKLLENNPWITVCVEQELIEKEMLYREQQRLAALSANNVPLLLSRNLFDQTEKSPWEQMSEITTLEQTLAYPLACTMLQVMIEMYFRILQLNNKLMCVSFRFSWHKGESTKNNHDIRIMSRLLELFDIKQRYPLDIDFASLPNKLDQLLHCPKILSGIDGNKSSNTDDVNNSVSRDNTGGSIASISAKAQPCSSKSRKDWDKQEPLGIMLEAQGTGAEAPEPVWPESGKPNRKQANEQKLELSAAEKMQLDLMWSSILQELQQCTGDKRQQIFEQHAAQWAEHLALASEISADFVLNNVADCNLAYISQELDTLYPDKVLVKLYFSLLPRPQQCSHRKESENAFPLRLSPNLLQAQPDTFALRSIKNLLGKPFNSKVPQYSLGLPKKLPKSQGECEQVLKHYQWHNLWDHPPMQRLQIHQRYHGNINLFLAKSVHQLLTEVGTSLLCQDEGWGIDVAPNGLFPNFEVFLYALNALEHQQAMFVTCLNCKSSQLVFNEHLLDQCSNLDLSCRQCGQTLQIRSESPRAQSRVAHSTKSAWRPSLG